MKRTAALFLFACLALYPAAAPAQHLAPDPLLSGGTGEPVKSSLEDILEQIVASRWHVFMASGSVSRSATSFNLHNGLNLIVGRGGAGYSGDHLEPLHGLGLLDHIEFVLQENIRLRSSDDAAAKVFRDGVVASLESVRRRSREAAELTRQALGEDDLNAAWSKARKARDLLFLAERGLDENRDGKLDWSEGGVLKAREAMRQLDGSRQSP